MNKLTVIAAIIGCAILTGCVSEEITWGGEKAVRQPDGTVLVNKETGAPYYEAEIVDGKVQITDGTTCVTCDKSGNCTSGTCSSGTCSTGNCQDTPASN